MDIEHVLQTALMLHRDGDVDGARKLYEVILTESPVHPAALLNMASIDLDQGNAQHAADRLQSVLAHDEDNGIAHLLYSRTCFATGNHEEGYAHVRSAFELIPEEEGVATEFVAAMRRMYFTFEQDEYLELFGKAQARELPEDRLQRLVHLAFLRIARPELIRLLVEPDLPEDTEDAIGRWMAELPESARTELGILARNFAQALIMMHESERFAAPAALVTLRKLPEEGGPDTLEVESIEDCDSLTGATLEIVCGGQVQFLPYSIIRSIEFDAPSAVMGVFVTLRDGNVLSGLMPLFYLFTEFSDSEKVRQGRSTLIRPLLAEAATGVGLRALRLDGNPLPVVRIEKLEFKD
jgi:tetratricopeptide (TPR) repeat protein